MKLHFIGLCTCGKYHESVIYKFDNGFPTLVELIDIDIEGRN